jgi:hypothetical protein
LTHAFLHIVREADSSHHHAHILLHSPQQHASIFKRCLRVAALDSDSQPYSCSGLLRFAIDATAAPPSQLIFRAIMSLQVKHVSSRCRSVVYALHRPPSTAAMRRYALSTRG